MTSSPDFSIHYEPDLTRKKDTNQNCSITIWWYSYEHDLGKSVASWNITVHPIFCFENNIQLLKNYYLLWKIAFELQANCKSISVVFPKLNTSNVNFSCSNIKLQNCKQNMKTNTMRRRSIGGSQHTILYKKYSWNIKIFYKLLTVWQR